MIIGLGGYLSFVTFFTFTLYRLWESRWFWIRERDTLESSD